MDGLCCNKKNVKRWIFKKIEFSVKMNFSLFYVFFGFITENYKIFVFFERERIRFFFGLLQSKSQWNEGLCWKLNSFYNLNTTLFLAFFKLFNFWKMSPFLQLFDYYKSKKNIIISLVKFFVLHNTNFIFLIFLFFE